jgi:hypothetical protein
MARIPDPKLHTLWRERIRRQAESGLTVAQFCAQQRLPVASFHTWKRRFRLIDLVDQHRALPAPATCAFVPVTVRVVEHIPDEPLPIEADLPNGIRLRIPTVNPRMVCRLIRAVAGAKTNSGGSR